MLRTRLMTFAILAAALILPGVARAQQVFWHVNYFDNVNISGAPDSKVRIVNSGGVAPLSILGGDVCAMTYVFDTIQELKECCGCLVTPDALLVLSVSSNLTSSTLDSAVLTAGVVKVVESLPNVKAGVGGTARPGSNPVCDPAFTPVPTGNASVLAVWGTHNQETGPGTFQITETGDHSVFSVFIDKGNVEPTILAALCLIDIQINGSGKGRCQCPGESTATPIWGTPTVSAPTSTTPTLSAPTLTAPKLSTPISTIANSRAPRLSAPTSSAPNSSTPKLSASTASSTPSAQR